jgi:hypothetical protein
LQNLSRQLVLQHKLTSFTQFKIIIKKGIDIMKQVSKIATNYHQTIESKQRTQKILNTSSRYTNDDARARARAAWIWSKLSEIFGANLLVSNFGETPPAAWKNAIEKLSDIEIHRALSNCLKRDDKYPPSLNEFLKMSKAERRHASHEIYKPLPKPEANEEIARENLSKIKKILKR